jgi:iron(III) transport system substrate-binding protein
VALLLAGCGGAQSAAPSTAATNVSAPAAAQASGGAAAAASGAAAAPASGGDTLSQLYIAAKQEGTVSVYASWQDDQFVPLQKGFEARYPGIKIDRLEISPNKGMERIITEKAAGKLSVDVAGARLSEIKQAIDRDLAASYDFAGTFKVAKEMVLNENRYVLAYHNASLLTYNTKLVDDKSAPKTWEDVLKPQFANGKILVAQDADDVFWALGKDWGKDKALDYARKIHDQKPRFSQSSSETTNLLIAGDAAVALSINASSAIKYTEQGAPIKPTGASPVSTNNNGLFVLKEAKHPNAARLWAGWIATPEAQGIFDKGSHRSVLFPGTNTGHAKLIQDLGVKLIFEDPQESAANAELQKQALQIVLGKA